MDSLPYELIGVISGYLVGNEWCSRSREVVTLMKINRIWNSILTRPECRTSVVGLCHKHDTNRVKGCRMILAAINSRCIITDPFFYVHTEPGMSIDDLVDSVSFVSRRGHRPLTVYDRCCHGNGLCIVVSERLPTHYESIYPLV